MNFSFTSVYPLILAGGSGTRLWPLSRKSLPKQFLKLGGSSSLIRETIERLPTEIPGSNIHWVCGQDHWEKIKSEFPNLENTQWIFEPCAKNTAAAIALAAFQILKKDPSAILIVMPADHKISSSGISIFRETLKTALGFLTRHEALLTLGITPNYPATGYGYIEKSEKILGEEVFRVAHFREKPNLETATAYLKNGGFFWNSGLFLWKAKTFLEAYRRFLPEDFKTLEHTIQNRNSDPSQFEKAYAKLTSISVDYAILERAENVCILPAAFDWDDIGSLQSLSKYYPKDAEENATIGNVVVVDAKKNFMISDTGIVACLGVEGLTIIRNGDALLILPTERSEEVKRLQEEIKKNGYESFL